MNQNFVYTMTARLNADQVKQGLMTLETAQTKLKQYGMSNVELKKQVGGSVKAVESQGKIMKTTSTSFRDANKNTYRFSEGVGQASRKINDFQRAMRRVLIVVPVWLAMRSALMFFLRTLSGGMRYWREFSAELMKAKGVIHSATGDIEADAKKLTKVIQQLSIETGKSMKELTSAFYRFGTVGLSFEESVKGMESAVKASLAMFGDADQYARTLALAYKLLGHTIDNTIPPQDRMMSVSAKLYTLWQKNAFEINDFTQSLQNFLPVANTMNLTLDETLALLASVSTGAVQGARGGRLLRTSFSKLVENIDDVATSLGLLVDIRVESPFEILMRVLDELQLMERAGDLEKASESIRAIFGGVRGGQVVRALVAMREVLRDNQELLEQGRYEEVFEKFLNRVEDVTNELDRQAQIAGNLRKQIGMTFIQGFLGGRNFEETLRNLNSLLEKAVRGAKTFGRVWSDIMSLGVTFITRKAEEQWNRIADMADRIGQVFEGKIPIEGIDQLIEQLEETSKILEKEPDTTFFALEIPETVFENLDFYIEKLKEVREAQEEAKMFPKAPEYTGEKYRSPFEPQLPPPITMTMETKLKLQELEEAMKYRRMELRGVSELQIAEQKLLDYIKKRVNAYNELKPKPGEIKKELDAQVILTELQAGNYEKIVELTKKRIIGEDEVIELKRIQNKLEGRSLELAEKYGEQLKSSFQEGFKELLAQEATVDEFINKVRDKLTDMWAEALSIKLTAPLEGIFGKVGGIFAGIEEPIRTGFSEGTVIAHDGIVSAFRIGSTMIITGGGQGYPGISQPYFPGRERDYASNYPGGYAPAGYTDPTAQKKGQSLFSTMGGWGGLAQIGMGGMFGGWQGALTAGLSMIHPMLGLAGMLFGGLFGGKKTTTETREATYQVASKLDITNKSLEIINRNIVALKRVFEGYVLPQSYYLQTALRGGLEGEFSLDVIKGFQK